MSGYSTTKSVNVREFVRSTRNLEVETLLENTIRDLKEEGYSVEFGKIGTHTTYALIYREDVDDEVVGYTYVRDMKFYKENVGKLRALQQAIARKNVNKG